MARGRRASTAPSSATPAKKTKVDPNMKAVQDAIKMHDALGASCQKMILAGLPAAVATPAGERQDSHLLIIRFVEESLAEVEAKLSADAEAQTDRAQMVEQSLGELEGVAAEQELVVKAAAEDVEAMAGKFADMARRVREAEAALAEKKLAQRSAAADHGKCKDKLTVLQASLDSHFKVLAEGGSETGKAYEALLPLIKDTALDQSLAAALPAACQKPGGERTSFDAMVIDSLGSSLREKEEALTKAEKEASGLAGGTQLAVDEAQEGLKFLEASKHELQEELSKAQKAQEEARAAQRRAKEAVASHGPHLAEAMRLKDEKAAALDNFRAHNKTCWELLRDGSAPEVAAGGQ